MYSMEIFQVNHPKAFTCTVAGQAGLIVEVASGIVCMDPEKTAKNKHQIFLKEYIYR